MPKCKLSIWNVSFCWMSVAKCTPAVVSRSIIHCHSSLYLYHAHTTFCVLTEFLSSDFCALYINNSVFLLAYSFMIAILNILWTERVFPNTLGNIKAACSVARRRRKKKCNRGNCLWEGKLLFYGFYKFVLRAALNEVSDHKTDGLPLRRTHLSKIYFPEV